MGKRKSNTRESLQAQIFSLHISLMGTEPLVWRRIHVPASFTLEALHSVLQLTMGWQMSHLYDFQIGTDRFAEPGEFDLKPVKAVTTKLSSAFLKQPEIFYNYDFGDGWRHTVTVEGIFSRNVNFIYPMCAGGANACPPEDCGGPPGYENLKAVVSNPEHEEFTDMMVWLGGYFDPTSFDANRINRDLLWNTNWTGKPNDQGLFHPFSAPT